MEKAKAFFFKLMDDWRFVVGLCLTLGLSPWFPEPHIWGKIMWLWGGAAGMGWIDWLDFFLHSIPWLLALRLLNKNFANF